MLNLSKKLKRLLRRSYSFLIDLINLVQGLFIYKNLGVTPEKSSLSLINLYCLTNGYSNSFLALIVKLFHRAYDFPSSSGVLGKLSSTQINAITKLIRDNGYYVFDNLLSLEICQRLTNLALSHECTVRDSLDPNIKVSVYNSDNPIATTYWLKEEDLINNPDIQNLMTDMSILSIAQAYLEAPPVLDIVTMWWSTPISKKACSDSAQLYHFDMDRIKWLKFFIYLTDVNTDNGPHCYISGSHRIGGKPKELLKRGYARIPDEDMEKFYSKEDLIEVTGYRGTIIAGDTLCFHKGKPLTISERLILELEFTNSLFGAPYQKTNFYPNPSLRILEFI
ncbi:MAG: phytanoyl-CoA dioxygenase family protein, partial [Pseudanabaena sp.]